MKTTLLLISSVIFYAAASAQCLVYEVPLSSRVQQAEAIFEGKVIAKKSFWNKQHTYIYTANTVEIYKVFKGNLASDRIEIITPGGVVDNRAVIAEPALKLSNGQTGIFFASAANMNIPVTGMKPVAGPQGFIRYHLSENSAADAFTVYPNISGNLYKKITALTKTNYRTVHPFNVDAVVEEIDRSAPPIITNLSPLTLSAGTRTMFTITGSGFGATQNNGYVAFKNSDNGGSGYMDVTDPKYYMTWTDNMIQLMVPGDVMAYSVGTGTVQVTNGSLQTGTSSQTLTVTFNRYEIAVGSALEKTIFYNDNSTGGYTFVPHTEVAALPAAVAAFQRAMDTWTCATNVNWIISGTTTTDAAASDGLNVIRFDNGSELSPGVLGMGSTYWAYTWGGVENYWRVTEMDITIDDGTNWNYGPGSPAGTQYDFESVMLHELGHLHQFNHVINTSSTMHYAIANGAMKRTLLSSDITGGNLVMSSSSTDATDAGISPMTPYTNNPSCIPTSIVNISTPADQPVYPNPAVDFIRVRFSKDAKVEVFNLIGESFKVNVAGDNLIDVTSLPRGIYVLKISDSYSSAAYRFSVAR